jgi:hypothetical protein
MYIKLHNLKSKILTSKISNHHYSIIEESIKSQKYQTIIMYNLISSPNIEESSLNGSQHKGSLYQIILIS